MTHLRRFALALFLVTLLLSAVGVFSQETTAGLQGIVKDPTGAVLPGAQVIVKADVLVRDKETTTDTAGYYRFANLPPGTYTVTVKAAGFATYKNEGVVLATGHLPTLDISLHVGGTETIVEVSGAAPAIDVTTNHTMTNVTEEIIQGVPHGTSFQSVIQFAPSARNEPLMGNNTQSDGTGGNAPGSTTNGGAFGFSVAGASDSENQYLVEGQETANLIGGYSHTNVPMDFIQEVQVKSSGVEAEHGGALGGVVNVIMKKGTNSYHGSIFSQFENDAMDGGPQAYSRYDPQSQLSCPAVWCGTGNSTNGYIDAASQTYQPKRAHSSDVFPGFTFGGPILKNRLFGFVAFNPEWNNTERFVSYPANSGLPGVPAAGGTIPFSRNQQTYYTNGRLDAVITQKLRIFGSWLYQYQRETGTNLPRSDSTAGLFNVGSTIAPFAYNHNLGFTAPNQTMNFGADLTITPHLVSTTRLGYYFENYHDFGYPTNGTLFIWQTAGGGAVDNQGNALPAALQHARGYFNDPYSGTYTTRNANAVLQFDQDLAVFKSGWMGTHNFKFGYQLHRLKNNILQSYSEPYVPLWVGDTSFYSPLSPTGLANCANATYIEYDSSGNLTDCAGLYGYAVVRDFGTVGVVTSFNHGLFAQDSWTVARGVTINAGVRFDKEYLPASSNSGLKSNPINFDWTSKVAPRLGFAWDVFRDNKMKVFASYGKFFDIMKLNVAISSFGGQYWNDCVYTLDTANLSTIAPALDSARRYCVGSSPTDTSTGAIWKGGNAPAGLTFIENINNRTFPTTCSTCSLTSTGVTPGLKPYEQHEAVLGIDYQIAKNLAFETRYDRRRLDHAIEDSSIINAGNETFVIGNPGQGVERTYNSFYNFLYGTAPPACSGSGCPMQTMIPAARSYDGVEFRLTRTPSASHWAAMFSYTYSRLRGNYTGLTSSDISDGQAGGRSSPNNSRAFDEPYFQYNSLGGSSSGLLPTDRPHTLKIVGYYDLSWLKKFSTTFGLFQYLYSGSPVTSYLDVGAGNGQWAVQAWNRGKFVDVTQDPTTGLITVGAPRTFRTPTYTNTDFSIEQNYKISERKALSFSVNASNLLNQRAVTAYNADITSLAVTNQYIALNDPTNSGNCAFGSQCYIGDGDPFYAAAERPYSVQAQLNDFKARGISAALNSAYKTPIYWQLSRRIRLGLKFTF